VSRFAVLLCLVLTLPIGGCHLFQGAAPIDAGEVAVEADAPPEVPWPALPEPGPQPEWSVPESTAFTLSNGVPVTWIQHGDVPLVRMQINVHTGSAADPAGRSGLAAFTADMMNEGAGELDALQISDELLTLASSLGVGAGLDDSSLSMECLEDKLDETLALAALVVMEPTFPADDVERIRGDRLARLVTKRDRLQTVGWETFSKVLYGDAYLGRPSDGTEASIGAITRDEMVDFHRRTWTADNASIVAAGRFDALEAAVLLERHLGSWTAGDPAERPAPPTVELHRHEGITIYWVDRPGAEQSYVIVGNVAPAFAPDRQNARTLSNDVLGGYFTARLNMNLREDKGYTYGARSSVSGRELGGTFSARASVKATTTAASLKEFMSEIRGIVGERLITEEEFGNSQSRSVGAFPAGFEGLSGVVGQFAHADATGRPEGWLAGHRARVEGVTLEQARAELAEIVDPNALAVVIVGDHGAEIELNSDTADGRSRGLTVTVGGQVEALELGPIVMLDESGSPLPTDVPIQR
jgi:zinc protease